MGGEGGFEREGGGIVKEAFQKYKDNLFIVGTSLSQLESRYVNVVICKEIIIDSFTIYNLPFTVTMHKIPFILF